MQMLSDLFQGPIAEDYPSIDQSPEAGSVEFAASPDDSPKTKSPNCLQSDMPPCTGSETPCPSRKDQGCKEHVAFLASIQGWSHPPALPRV
jgi:hypothetical protein